VLLLLLLLLLHCLPTFSPVSHTFITRRASVSTTSKYEPSSDSATPSE
jgi:hypothetical protein